MQLSERAMLVSLSISTWTARKKDKQATAEVAANHGASERIGNYRKRLLPENAPEYAAVVTAAGTARTAFYENTLAWSNDGSRILPAANYLRFAEIMRKTGEDFRQAVAAFVPVIGRLKAEARNELNGLFREEDYPSEQQLESKFAFKVVTFPLPDAADFRVSLSNDDTEAIKSAITAEVMDGVKEAARDAWNRLSDALKRMHERLSQEDAIYRDTLFTNLQELTEVLPALNLLDDPCMEQAIEQVKAQVLTFTPKDCREDKAARKDAAGKVADILSSMQGFYDPATP